jgi:hypothetical protein
MGFSDVSIRRNPAADLGGGTFSRVSDSLVSAAESLFGLTGGGAALEAIRREMFGSGYVLKLG